MSEIKTGLIQDAIFIHPDLGYAKIDKSRENEVKIRRNRDGNWTKKDGKSHLDINFMPFNRQLLWANQKDSKQQLHHSWFECRFIIKKWSGLQRQMILWNKIKKLWCNNEKSNKRTPSGNQEYIKKQEN